MLINPSSTVPMVGASGAIGGVMTAYAVLFPNVRVKLLVFLGIIFTTINVPAMFMIGYWFILKLLSAATDITTRSGGGVAFFAHIGGFVCGVIIITLYKRFKWVKNTYYT